MKRLYILFMLMLGLLIMACGNNYIKKKNDQWKFLFNGKNLENWIVKIHKHELGDNFANTFRVENATLLVSYDDYDDFEDRYGHLFYQQEFSNFHLKFEYKFTDQWMKDAPGYTYRNSGVMFHSQAPETILKNQDWPISVEYQILARATEGESRPTGNMCSPGTDVVFQGKIDPRHCINSSSKTYEWDQWVSGELIAQDNWITHIVNGEIVLEYYDSQIGGGTVQGHHPDIKIDGKLLKKGYIGFQAEGQGIKFRNIKIKEL